MQSRSNVLTSEIEELSETTRDPTVAEALNKVAELMQVNLQLQSIYAIHLLSALKQSETEIDEQLNEIAGYLEVIVASRQREADNLRKIQ